MNPHYSSVARRARHCCEYCHAPEVIFNFPFEVEHVIPVTRGGLEHDSNLALSCRSCNLRKSDHIEVFDTESESSVPLFHPRRNLWAEHFGVDIDTGTIVGRTPTGRATIEKLRMNAPTQLMARRHWMKLGLFP
ncbi:MAG: HNH endonuclease [Planctomycetes bacterium]|nr:HNH endonuclease [Planctomycetota bacterium]MBL7039151.1 HNH endonuclease [Pirellulaceae bacterium]